MLSPERIFPTVRKLGLVLVAGLGLIVSACTVQPLYQGGKGGEGAVNVAPTVRQKLSSIVIEMPNDRFSQMVRNRLIFLIGGGSGEPTTSTYQLALNASYTIRTAVQVDIGDTTDRTGRASAGVIVGQSKYVLKDLTSKVVAKRSRSVSASFDRPRQEYANYAAEEDAKKRAAEELAEQIFLSLAQDVAKL